MTPYSHSHSHSLPPPPSSTSPSSSDDLSFLTLPPLSLPPPLPSDASPRASLLLFLSLQELRASTYHSWESAFRLYLDRRTAAGLRSYTDLCQVVTVRFQTLSLRVKLLMAQLQEADARLAGVVAEVQQWEARKLRLTVEMQELASEWVVLRKEPFARDFHERQAALREAMSEAVEAINDRLGELRYDVRYRKQ